jgi:hypothetical protein
MKPNPASRKNKSARKSRQGAHRRASVGIEKGNGAGKNAQGYSKDQHLMALLGFSLR